MTRKKTYVVREKSRQAVKSAKAFWVSDGFLWVLKLVSAWYTGLATWEVYGHRPLPVVLVEGAYLSFWVWVDLRAGKQSQDRLFDALGLGLMFAAVLAIGWADSGWLALWPRLALALLVGRSVLAAATDYQSWKAGRWSTDMQRAEARAERQLKVRMAADQREVERTKADALKAAQMAGVEALRPELEALVQGALRVEWLGLEEAVPVDAGDLSAQEWAQLRGAQLGLPGIGPKGEDGAGGSGRAVPAESASSTGT